MCNKSRRKCHSTGCEAREAQINATPGIKNRVASVYSTLLGNPNWTFQLQHRRLAVEGVNMATEWGDNFLAPGASAGWFFVRPASWPAGNVPLPVLSVRPLSSSHTGALWFGGGNNYPFVNELGASTIWSQLSDDATSLIYFMVVSNNSRSSVAYSFLESVL
jgi:hypothetical protein